MHTFALLATLVATPLPWARPFAPIIGGRCAHALMGTRRRRGDRTPLPPRVLERSPDGVPEIAQCHPELYDELLRIKVASLEDKLASATQQAASSLPHTEVYESERTHFRMRAAFSMWREGDGVHYVMFNRDDARTPREVTSYPMGSMRLNELMTPLRDAMASTRVLREKINDVRFLTTTMGDALATITYNTPIGDEWVAAAAEVSSALGVHLVGRSRKVKLVVGGETVQESLNVPGRGICMYTQTEGAFTQPNAGVCAQMLGWAFDATAGSSSRMGSDLCELYCGNGCFTVALAPNFRRVVATELSKASVELAEANLAANACDNVRVARLSAEDFVKAYADGKPFRRLEEAGISLSGRGDDGYDLTTLFVDPPRAGLDETCRTLASRFERVVYVSCNPETLARDVADLAATHRVTRVAAFDQFPYTPHLEAGIVLERR